MGEGGLRLKDMTNSERDELLTLCYMMAQELENIADYGSLPTEKKNYLRALVAKADHWKRRFA